jgi:hypothetical protein
VSAVPTHSCLQPLVGMYTIRLSPVDTAGGLQLDREAGWPSWGALPDGVTVARSRVQRW